MFDYRQGNSTQLHLSTVYLLYRLHLKGVQIISYLGGAVIVVFVGLLGEIGLQINGRVVRVLGGKQQLLLAALALRSGQMVSAEELIGRLWGDSPPPSAKTTLRSHVMRLRKVLSTAGQGSLVDAASGGYRLHVGPEAVDVHSFRRLLSRSRAESEQSHALVLIDLALGLWRGEVLAGLDLPWAETTRRTLEQERFTAEAERIDLALECGRHNALVAELVGRTETYPLDEGAAAQLMLALYRSGRTADSLAHFHRMRSRLADQLGTDPDPSLQRLHQRILTADATLAPPACLR
jgi:DNA-binding SARP family transcriptional activator